MGFLLIEILSSFSDTLVCFRIASTVNRCCDRALRRVAEVAVDLGGGIDVRARRAATEGGMASGEWISRARCAEGVVCFFPLYRRSFRSLCLWPSFERSR